MALVTTGLTNGGLTKHFSFHYDDSLSKSQANPNGPEPDRTNAVIAACESDYELISSWFDGAKAVSGLTVNVTSGSGGASWAGTSAAATVTLNPVGIGFDKSPDLLRYLLVAEVTEIFMLDQNKGWFQNTDEGSKGEGLSRFLSAQFLIINNLLATGIQKRFGLANSWLNSMRQDFINNDLNDNNPDTTNGCTTLFIYYLNVQFGFEIPQIVAAAGPTLAAVYATLTGDATDPFPQFKLLLDTIFPSQTSSSVPGSNSDNPYPLLNVYSLAGNTAGFGGAEGVSLFWTGDFTGSGKTQTLFWFPGDQNYWLGQFNGDQIAYSLAGNTSGFGGSEAAGKLWVGRFTGGAQDELLFWFPGDKNYWLGQFNGGKIAYSLAGNTAGFGGAEGVSLFWTGDFTGSGKTQTLFWFPGDQNYWLGQFNGNQIAYSLAGNTSGFGGGEAVGKLWVGRFTGGAQDELLFWFPGDKNYWLGQFTGGKIAYSLVGNTAGFRGAEGASPLWTGDFIGSGKRQILFWYPGDKNYWLGRF